MGARGPIPKRSEERIRRNRPTSPVSRSEGAACVKPPPANKDWHPIAKRMWRALKESGQAKYCEPSDWAYAYSLMEDLTYYKNSDKRSGQMLAALLSGMTPLMMTEGDRRRLQLELERPRAESTADSDKIVSMSEWKRRLSA